MRKIIWFVFILSTLASVAQTTGDKKEYNLEECVNIALNKNFDIHLSEAQLATTHADLVNAFGLYLPSISFNMGYSRDLKEKTTFNISGTNIPIAIDNRNSYYMNANASWTLFDGFSREANYDRANKTKSVYEERHQQTIDMVKIDVIKKYIDIIKNYRIVEIRKENFVLGKSELERIRAQYEAGVISVGAVYAQEADLGDRELQIVTAENQLSMAKSTLLAYMGLNPVGDSDFEIISLPESISKDEIDSFEARYGNFSELIDKSLQNRRDLTASKINVEVAETSVRQARSDYFPVVRASGGWQWSNYEWSNFNQGTPNVGVSMSVPIFTNFSTGRQVENAKLQLEQSKIDMERTQQQVKTQVQTAFVSLKSAEKTLEITQKTIKSAERNYESAKERFQVGSASINELHDANLQYVTTKINLVNSVYDYFKAKNELLYSIGEF